MIAARPRVGWIGDYACGGLTVYATGPEGDAQLPGIELGHGIPTAEATRLQHELEDLLEVIVRAQRGHPAERLGDRLGKPTGPHHWLRSSKWWWTDAEGERALVPTGQRARSILNTADQARTAMPPEGVRVELFWPKASPVHDYRAWADVWELDASPARG